MDQHPGSQDRLRQVGVGARPPGERDEQVKSGRDALDAGRGQVLAQRPEQGASRAGLLTGVAPVAAAAAGVLLGGPAPRPLVWAGIAVVAVGLALGFREGRD